MKKFFQQMWATPKYHAFILAIYSSITGAVTPFILSFYTYCNSYMANPTVAIAYQFPSLKMIGCVALAAGVSGVIGYFIKNGQLGSSNIALVNRPPTSEK